MGIWVVFRFFDTVNNADVNIFYRYVRQYFENICSSGISGS